MSKLKKIIIVLIVLVFAIIAVLYFTIFNKYSNKYKISLNNTVEDFEVMEKVSRDFINNYFNYNSKNLRNGNWKKSIYPYIDKKAIKQHKNSELFNFLYDEQWQLSYIVNDLTSSEVIDIDYITPIYKDNDVYVTTQIILRKNGSDDVTSPYFNMLQKLKNVYTIEFTSENKIYSIKCNQSIILETGSDYGNT